MEITDIPQQLIEQVYRLKQKERGAEGGKKSRSNLTPEQRSAHGRMMAEAKKQKIIAERNAKENTSS